MIDAALLACAPQIAPATLEAVIRVESRGRPLAINVNRGPQPPAARNAAEAATFARAAIARGYSVDLGLMQVNSRNLARLGYTVEQMFEPCLNIQAGATVLSSNYSAAVQKHGPGQPALLAALSAYNTGNFAKGFRNGYVARYFDKRSANIVIGQFAGLKLPQKPTPFSSDTSVYKREEISVAQSDTPQGVKPAASSVPQPE